LADQPIRQIQIWHKKSNLPELILVTQESHKSMKNKEEARPNFILMTWTVILPIFL